MASVTVPVITDQPHPARPSALKPRSLWRDAAERFSRNRLARVGVVVILLLLFIAAFGPSLTPYDHLRQNWDALAMEPSPQHWLGTDDLGRDLFSRILAGARTAVLVAVVTQGISSTLGVLLGALAGYRGGWVDALIMRVADVVMSFPAFLLAAFVNASAKVPVQGLFDAAYAGTGWGIFEDALLVDYVVVFGALALVWWPGIARLVRGQVLSLKSHDFVTAARALGAPTSAVLLRHLLPNVLGPVIVAVTFGLGGAMLAEAGLSFLGIGIQPPGASWGKMINDNVGYWNTKPHLVMAPAMVLALAALAFNFVGDGLNDALNPRDRRR